MVMETVPTLVYDPIYDLDNDGVIGDRDVSLFNSCLGRSKWVPSTWTELAQRADFDGSGTVDITDWARMSPHVGAVAPEIIPTPEISPTPPVSLASWFPMSPFVGPPLPLWLGLKWPWYKEGV